MLNSKEMALLMKRTIVDISTDDNDSALVITLDNGHRLCFSADLGHYSIWIEDEDGSEMVDYEGD